MARTREIKPAFFRNPTLLDLPIHARLLFIGLWTEADREGRLEDRPRYLKRELLTYDDCNVDELLSLLASTIDEDGQPFITRYQVNGQKLIHITKFTKHQRIHPKEALSVLPGMDGETTPEPESTDLEPVSGQAVELHGKPRNYPESRVKDEPSREKVVVSRAIPSALSEPSALNSVPNGTGVPPAEPEEKIQHADAGFDIWRDGLELLTRANVPEQDARKFIGMCRKTHGDDAVLEAFKAVLLENPADPRGYLQGCLRRAGEKKPVNVRRLRPDPDEERYQAQFRRPGV